jgi:hypothetical protein
MWTKEIPSAPGYYWWRYSNEKGNPRIVKILRNYNGLFVTYFGTEIMEPLGVTPGVFWTDPIVCPDGDRPVFG